MDECIIAACVNYCCKICWYFCNNSISPPGWPSQDQHLSSTLSRKSWTLLFSEGIKSREKLNAIGLIFKTNFQGILRGLRVIFPRGSPHLPLRSQLSKSHTCGVPRSSILEEILNLSRDLMSSCWSLFRNVTSGISFIPTTYLQVQKSFFPPVLFLPNRTQVPLIQSHHIAQPAQQLGSNLSTFLEANRTSKLKFTLGFYDC